MSNSTITAGAASYDRFATSAIDGLVQCLTGRPAPSEGGRYLAKNRGLHGIISEDSKLRGLKPSSSSSSQETFTTWLKANAGPVGEIPLDAAELVQNSLTGMAAFPSVLGGVLSGMANNLSVSDPQITFPDWAWQLPDVDDFRPAEVLAVSGAEQFGLRVDGTTNWLEISADPGFLYNDIYDNGFSLSPRQLAINSGLLALEMRSLGVGHDLTLEHLIVMRLVAGLAGQADLAFDGQAVFSEGTLSALTPAARGNVIPTGTGGGPSFSQFGQMRKHARKQVRNKLLPNGKYAKFRPGAIETVLVPSYWEESAYMTLLAPTRQDAKVKLPTPIYVPLLDEVLEDLGLEKTWFATYSGAPFMVYAYQRGFGPRGKQTARLNPETECLEVRWEGRFGCTVMHPQAGQRNPGE